MARIRTLKPEILEDEKVAALSDAAYRLFTSMIVLADDHGNVRADARWLQAQIWWAHPSPPNVLALLVELSRSSLVDAYGVRGGTYSHLRGWEKHQRIDNAGKNRVPLPDDPDAAPIDLESTEPLKRESAVESCGQTNGKCATDGPPILAEKFRETRLDPDPDPDQEMEVELDAAAKPRPANPKPPRSLSAMPSHWSPRPEERERARELGLNCDDAAEHFRDHHTAKGTKFKDWDAAFRTWLRNAKSFGRSNTRPNDGLQAALDIARGIS